MFIHSNTEKDYLINQVVGMLAASLEVSLILPALFSITKGIRGIYNLFMIVQYLIYRNGVDSNVAVGYVCWVYE